MTKSQEEEVVEVVVEEDQDISGKVQGSKFYDPISVRTHELSSW